VVATGAASGLLVRAGLLRRTPPVGLAVRAYFEGFGGPHDRIQFRFDGVPLPGYGWVFPLPGDGANVGLGLLRAGWPGRSGGRAESRAGWPGRGAHGVSPQAAFDAFLRRPAIRDLLAGAERRGPVKGYPFRTDFPAAPTSAAGVLLAGEAAGLVNPLTGEGIDYALESGRLCAEHVARMVTDGDFSPSRRAAYDRVLRERFQDLFEFCARLRSQCATRPMLNLLVALASRRGDLAAGLADVVLGGRPLPEGPLLPRALRAVLLPSRARAE